MHVNPVHGNAWTLLLAIIALAAFQPAQAGNESIFPNPDRNAVETGRAAADLRPFEMTLDAGSRTAAIEVNPVSQLFHELVTEALTGVGRFYEALEALVAELATAQTLDASMKDFWAEDTTVLWSMDAATSRSEYVLDTLGLEP